MKKQFNFLNYFNMQALFLGIGLSRIISNTHEYFPISIIFGTILGLFLLYFIKINMKKNIINIIINAIIIMYGIIILINLISTTYLTKMPNFLIILPFVLTILYLANKKEIISYRIANILIIFNIILYIISCFSLLKYFNISTFYSTNIAKFNIFTSSLEYTLLSITPTLITRNNGTKNIPIYKTYIMSSLTLMIIFILTYSILGPNLASIIRFPEYMILKRIAFSSFENMENILSFVWINNLFILVLSCTNSIKYNLLNPKYLNYVILIIFIITVFLSLYAEVSILMYHQVLIIFGILLILLILFNYEKKKQ